MPHRRYDDVEFNCFKTGGSVMTDYKKATKALQNILSNPDQVIYGNGVNMDGSLYPDVKEGLAMALKLLIKEEV